MQVPVTVNVVDPSTKKYEIIIGIPENKERYTRESENRGIKGKITKACITKIKQKEYCRNDRTRNRANSPDNNLRDTFDYTLFLTHF